ncbi:hypothetical protein [Roseospira goensis]|uniref:Uncharacterized protein n=1 Tax=Roseospira goensis TaxID=391922 RepID=A0A7W6WL18_9PROT|nr:hypothetical protein [Roseospira goensis]MBB4286243.1 hypothetical protein [Roseospira goensis]
MISIVDVTLGQKWRVHQAFRVHRNGVRYEVPAGGTLIVKTVPKGCDEVWVTYGYNRFRISQENMKAHAHPA